MITIAAFSEIVSLIYAAAVSPRLWEDALALIHLAMTPATVGVGQVRSSTLTFSDGTSRWMIGNLAPEADRAYREHYGALDTVMQAVERGPVGVLRTGTELIAPLRHTEFYNEWVHPHDLGDGIFVRLSDDADPTSLVVAGSRATEAFDTDERTRLLALLIPHLRQAMSAQRGLSSLSWRAGELSQALDSVEHAMVTVRPGFRIEDGNVAAERLLRLGDGLVAHDGRLSSSIPQVRAKLESVLGLALDGDAVGVRHGGSLACVRPSGKRAYAVRVLPLRPPETEFVRRGPSAVVVIVDPERRPVPAPELLRQQFGFTKTEATVAQLLVNGQGLGPIGEHLLLSRDTVKTHLSNIFHKTGTHRQAELVRLLLVLTA